MRASRRIVIQSLGIVVVVTLCSTTAALESRFFDVLAIRT